MKGPKEKENTENQWIYLWSVIALEWQLKKTQNDEMA